MKKNQLKSLENIIDRRMMLKLMGYSLVGSVLAPSVSSVLSPVLAQSSSFILLSSALWKDKQMQQAVNDLALANFSNIYTPQNQIAIGFPLSGMPSPSSQLVFDIEQVGLIGETFEEIVSNFNPSALAKAIEDLREDGNENNPFSREAMERSLATQEALKNMLQGSEGIVVTAAGAGVAVAAVGVALSAFALGWQIGKDIRNAQDDDGDGVPNDRDKFPKDKNKNVVAQETDVNNNGVPDHLEEHGDFFRGTMNAIGVGPEVTEALTVQMSFEANDSALMINCAVAGNGMDSTTQLILKG